MQIVLRTTYIERIVLELQKDKLVLLTGARQVGKTTLMKQVDEHMGTPSLMVNMEDWFGENWSNKQDFIDWISITFGFDVYQKWLLMLDEVQYLKMPEALLKSLYDDTDIQCYILATWSRFRWQSRVWSTLVGRWGMIRVWPYSFVEFLQSKDLHIDRQKLATISYWLIEKYIQEYMIYGWYPAVVHTPTQKDKIQRMDDIIWRMLERDFLAYLSRDELIDFRKVFQFVARSIWSLWKTNKIAQEIGLSNYKVDKYIQFLQDLYIIETVHPYFTDRTKEYKSHKELFFHDIWLHSYFTWQWIYGSNGKVTENFVYTHLRRDTRYRAINYRKNRAGSEIDFVAETVDGSIIPIEVKTWNKTHIPKIFHSFFETYKEQVSEGIVTTKTLRKQEYIGDVSIHFIPYWIL